MRRVPACVEAAGPVVQHLGLMGPQAILGAVVVPVGVDKGVVALAGVASMLQWLRKMAGGSKARGRVVGAAATVWTWTSTSLRCQAVVMAIGVSTVTQSSRERTTARRTWHAARHCHPVCARC